MKVNNMNKFEKRQLVMLPTNDVTPIVKDRKGYLYWRYDFHPVGSKYQHLYILSEETIKEGDWMINTKNLILGVLKATNKDINNIELYQDFSCKKIIATIDESLKLQDEELAPPCEENNWLGEYQEILIPKLSQEFIKYDIEEYNKGNIITEVEVEYEEISKTNEELEYDKPSWNEYIIINSDNTINIKFPIEEKLYNRDEVIGYCMNAYNQGLKDYQFGNLSTFDKWIDKNL